MIRKQKNKKKQGNSKSIARGTPLVERHEFDRFEARGYTALGFMQVANNSRLLAEGRRRKILELVEQTGQVTIHDVVNRFAVSAVTARSDLDALSTNGAVLRSHGGAVRYEATQDYPLKLKATLHRSEKARIGQAAAKLVQPNETIILDSGTTTAEIAKNLKRSKVKFTVITSALNIANELADAPAISLFMLGGLLRTVSYSFVGPQAEAMLRDLHADRLFLAVDGLDLAGGPFTPDVLEAQLNGLMMKVSKEVTVVADSTKLGRRSLFRIGPIENIHRLITDERAPEEFTDALRNKGIDVILV
jgi:DeoR family transcriptional regulator, aga operon transcriptional repressor